jgi:uncharacterized membrane protein
LDKSQPSASSSSRRPPSELKLLGRQWVLHARLFVSAALGIAVTLALLALPWRMSTRLLVGWDIGVALYLALSCRVAARASITTIRQRAAINDEGAIALLVLVIAAARRIGVRRTASRSLSSRRPLRAGPVGSPIVAGIRVF